MEEVSAGEQRRGTGLPTKQSSLFCLAFGCCTEHCMHHTASGLSWWLMHYCKMNHTAKWKDARGGYSHPASCLHCFHDGHIHLLDDTLLINVVNIIEGDVSTKKKSFCASFWLLNFKKILIRAKKDTRFCLAIHQRTSTGSLFLQIKNPSLCHGMNYNGKSLGRLYPAVGISLVFRTFLRGENEKMTLNSTTYLLFFDGVVFIHTNIRKQ